MCLLPVLRALLLPSSTRSSKQRADSLRPAEAQCVPRLALKGEDKCYECGVADTLHVGLEEHVSLSPPAYSPNGSSDLAELTREDPPAYTFFGATVNIGLLHKTLLLSNNEAVRYLSQHGRQGIYRDCELLVSTKLAFQTFATMTLRLAGSAIVECLDVCPTQLRMRLREDFFTLGPNAIVVLSAITCVIGILGRGTFDLQAYMYEFETAITDLLGQDYQRNVCVVYKSNTFKLVQENLLGNPIIKYRGFLVQDMEHGFVSAIISPVLTLD